MYGSKSGKRTFSSAYIPPDTNVVCVFSLTNFFHVYLLGNDPLAAYWVMNECNPCFSNILANSGMQPELMLPLKYEQILCKNICLIAQSVSSLHSWPNKINFRLSISNSIGRLLIRLSQSYITISVLVLVLNPCMYFKHNRCDLSIVNISLFDNGGQHSAPYKALGRTTDSYMCLQVKGCSPLSLNPQFTKLKNVPRSLSQHSFTICDVLEYWWQVMPKCL